MKPLKYFAIIGAALFALSFTAQAHLDYLGSVGKDTVGNNSPPADLLALGGIVDTTGFVLCGNFEDLNEADQTISVMAGAYLVVHYGKGDIGKGGSKGGSLEFFHVVAGETTVTVPGFANGPTNPDTHAAGGISSIREFCPPGTNLPDSGTTAMLLGSALTGLGLVRRYWKR